MLSVFIAGVTKYSGKSLVTAGLAATMQSLSYSTGIFKPIKTGVSNIDKQTVFDDFDIVRKCDTNILTKSLYSLSHQVSPFVGAYEDNVKIDMNEIFSNYHIFADNLDFSFVEGANSIASPIAQNLSEIDIIKTLDIPLVLIVNPLKTSVDEVLLALAYIKSHQIQLLGIIINQYDENAKNLEMKYFPQIIKEFSGVNILGCMPDYGNLFQLDPGMLIADILNCLNLEEIFALRIAKLEGAE